MLEVGGGLGEIQLELLKRGAARSLTLELSPDLRWTRRCAWPARRASTARVERRSTTSRSDPDAVEPADVVVLNRVVCCYPDYERLLGAAADHARPAAGLQPSPAQPALDARWSAWRTSASGCGGGSSAPSRTRPRRCSRCSSAAACAPATSTAAAGGTSPGSSARLRRTRRRRRRGRRRRRSHVGHHQRASSAEPHALVAVRLGAAAGARAPVGQQAQRAGRARGRTRRARRRSAAGARSRAAATTQRVLGQRLQPRAEHIGRDPVELVLRAR